MKRVATILGLVVSSASCLEVPPPGQGACPVDVDANGRIDPTNFAPVSLVLEQRCGSLDCHGNVARPLRIYGARGLRYVPLYTVNESGQVTQAPEATAYVDPVDAEENGYYPGAGGVATTEIEREQTVRSICGLQPETMRQVVVDGADPEKLMLLSKPLHLERHKGQKVFERGSLDYACLVSWLTSKLPEGAIDADSCNETLQNP